MIYLQKESLIIRSMKDSDKQDFVDAFKEQGWQKSLQMFEGYFKQQSINELRVIVAEVDNHISGYVTLVESAKTGPFAVKKIPEVVDLNVLIKHQRNGIGSKLMDVAETLAREKNDFLSLAVGMHYGYGPAQRMYVKRGYIPDGSGVWYNGKQLEQYSDCNNDDNLTLYFLKKL